MRGDGANLRCKAPTSNVLSDVGASSVLALNIFSARATHSPSIYSQHVPTKDEMLDRGCGDWGRCTGDPEPFSFGARPAHSHFLALASHPFPPFHVAVPTKHQPPTPRAALCASDPALHEDPTSHPSPADLARPRKRGRVDEGGTTRSGRMRRWLSLIHQYTGISRR